MKMDEKKDPSPWFLAATTNNRTKFFARVLWWMVVVVVRRKSTLDCEAQLWLYIVQTNVIIRLTCESALIKSKSRSWDRTCRIADCVLEDHIVLQLSVGWACEDL